MLVGLVAAGFYICFYGSTRGGIRAGAGVAGLELGSFLFPEIRHTVPLLTAFWMMLTEIVWGEGAGFRNKLPAGRREGVFLAGGVWLMARSLAEICVGNVLQQTGLQQGGLQQLCLQQTAPLRTALAAALFAVAGLYLLGRGRLYPLWMAALVILWLLAGFLGGLAYEENWQVQVMSVSLYVTAGGILVFQQIFCIRQELESGWWLEKRRELPTVVSEMLPGAFREAGAGSEAGENWHVGTGAGTNRQVETGADAGTGANRRSGTRAGFGIRVNRQAGIRIDAGTGVNGCGRSRTGFGTGASRRAGTGANARTGANRWLETGANAGSGTNWREEAGREYRELAIFEHDFRHHLDIVAALYEEGSAEEARSYIEDLKQARESRQGRVTGGERELSYIMMAKRKACRQAEISFSYQIVGTPRGIARMDMTALLLNLLDNAIRACEEAPKPRSIGVMLLSRGELWEIEMVNSGRYEPGGVQHAEQRREVRREEPQQREVRREESQRREARREESQRREARWEEPQQREVRWEEPQQREVQREESQRREARREEPQQREVRREEPQQREVRREEPQRKEARWEEPQQREVRREEPQRREVRRKEPQQAGPQWESVAEGGMRRKAHGIGMISVRQIVDKYHGICRIWEEDGQVRQKLILVQRNGQNEMSEPESAE